MRDMLIELIESARYWGAGTSAEIADRLLAEGVIVPPMRLGQTCYKVYDSIDACRVSSITQKADGSFKIRLTYLRGRWVFEIKPEDFGKTVFLTKEEAEKALAERREG